MSVKNYYDSYWSTDANWSPSEGKIHPIEQKFFDQYLTNGRSCLDYGCGDGRRYGGYLQHKGVGYYGFDISSSAVEQAKRGGVNVELLTSEGAIQNDSVYEFAICFEVLEHLLDPEFALKEIFKHLKQQGYLIVSVPNSGIWHSRINFLLTGFFNPGGSPLTSRKKPWSDPHIRFFNPKMMVQLLNQVGEGDVRFLPAGFSFGNIPYFYKKKWWVNMCKIVDPVFGWLGNILPGLFSSRLFFIIRKS